MLDPISLATGGCLLVVGWIVGRIERTRSVVPEAPGRDLHLRASMSSHAKDGRCHASVERAKEWNYCGEPTSYEHVPCACQQYVGPKPFDELYAPLILPPTQG